MIKIQVKTHNHPANLLFRQENEEHVELDNN